MECPNCKINNELTRSRYFKSPFSRFICDNCQTKFKFKRPWSWYIWVVVSGSMYVITLIGSLMIFNNENIWLQYSIISAIYFLIYIEIDRKLESNYETKYCKNT